MSDIQQDVERARCVRHIINLCAQLDHQIDDVINNHYMKFEGRNSTHEEWEWILRQVQEITRNEKSNGILTK